MTASLIEALAKFDTPTVCNAIELFAVRPQHTGYMNGSIRSRFPKMPPMVGYACTATFRADSVASPKSAYGSTADQVELMQSLPGPAVMVFQDLDDQPVAATFGEMMCSTYKSFGSTGLITSGGGRDLHEVEALGYPVFTGDIICSHGYPRITTIGEPVRVGGVMLEGGELLHGDANGVTTIPHEIASEIPEAAQRLADAERILLSWLAQTPEPTVAKLREVSAEVKEALVKARKEFGRGKS